MEIVNAIKFAIIMVLVFCTISYIFPEPSSILMIILKGLLVVIVGLSLSYFIMGKENLKKK